MPRKKIQKGESAPRYICLSVPALDIVSLLADQDKMDFFNWLYDGFERLKRGDSVELLNSSRGLEKATEYAKPELEYGYKVYMDRASGNTKGDTKGNTKGDTKGAQGKGMDQNGSDNSEQGTEIKKDSAPGPPRNYLTQDFFTVQNLLNDNWVEATDNDIRQWLKKYELKDISYAISEAGRCGKSSAAYVQEILNTREDEKNPSEIPF